MFNVRLLVIGFMLGVAMFANAQFAWGVKGGILLSNFYGLEMSDSRNIRYGFNLGVVADYNFQSDMSILTGLNFRNATITGGSVDYDDLYVQVPLYYSYKIYFNSTSRVVFRGGPYVAFGVLSKRDDEGIKNMTFGNSGPFDAGIGIGSGVEANKLLFDIGVDLGLTDLNYPSHSTTAYITIGFLF